MEHSILTQLVGVLFLLYGIAKLIIFFAILAIPPKMQERLSQVSGVNMIITGDHTTAGRAIEWVLVVFAVFSMVHGMALMGAFPDSIDCFIESHAFQYAFYGFLGIFMVVFYSLVLYTNLPISKNPKNYNMYWIYGYLIGASFLIVPILWELSTIFMPALGTMPAAEQLMYMTLIFFVLFLLALYAYYLYTIRMRRQNEAKARSQ